MDLIACTYEVDGVHLTGFMADGASGASAPGILLAHESPGLTAHVKERTRELAQRGYVAFALDMYGQADLPIDRAREHSQRLMTDAGLMRRRARAALDLLASHAHCDGTRLAAVGFCREAGADWQLHVFGGVGHSYTDREIDAMGMPGFAYNERADQRAWRLMLSLFDEAL